MQAAAGLSTGPSPHCCPLSSSSHLGQLVSPTEVKEEDLKNASMAITLSGQRTPLPTNRGLVMKSTPRGAMVQAAWRDSVRGCVFPGTHSYTKHSWPLSGL